MIAQLALLAVGVAVFVAVTVLDRWLERRRIRRYVREHLPELARAFEALAVTFGEQLTPAVTDAARAINDFADAWAYAWYSAWWWES